VIREKDIEAKVVEWAKKNGWLTFKFVSPSQRGVPDRIFIKDGFIVFIEFKAPGKKPTQLQAHMIRKLRDAECEVHVCDSVESACDALSL
jgi:Holliday junction resolvase